jgi:hypothetical protein
MQPRSTMPLIHLQTRTPDPHTPNTGAAQSRHSCHTISKAHGACWPRQSKSSLAVHQPRTPETNFQHAGSPRQTGHAKHHNSAGLHTNTAWQPTRQSTASNCQRCTSTCHNLLETVSFALAHATVCWSILGYQHAPSAARTKTSQQTSTTAARLA